MIHQGKTVLFIKVKVCLIHCTKNEQETADLVTFTEEILNGRLHFLCSDSLHFQTPAAVLFEDLISLVTV